MNQLAPDLLSLRPPLGHISARSFKRIKNKSIVKSSRCLCITSGAGLRDVIMTASLKVRGQNCSRAGINKMDYSRGKNERPQAHKNRISVVDHLTASDVKDSEGSGLTCLNGLILSFKQAREA